MVKIILDTEDIAFILLILIWFIVAVGFTAKCKIKEIKENRKKKKEEKDADSN